MGSYRLRFTPQEREAFTPGTEVQWLNATTWKRGVIEGPIDADMGAGADQRQQVIPVRNHDGGLFVKVGEVLNILPKHVRLYVSKEA